MLALAGAWTSFRVAYSQMYFRETIRKVKKQATAIDRQPASTSRHVPARAVTPLCRFSPLLGCAAMDACGARSVSSIESAESQRVATVGLFILTSYAVLVH